MKAEAFNQQGLQHKNAGRLVEAEQAFRQALQADRRYLPALGNLGVVLRLAGRPAEAVPLLERLVELAPRLPAAHFSLGNVEADLGQHKRAVVHFQRAIELDPQHAEAWVNMGNSHLARQHRDLALPCFRRAATLRPDLFEAQYSLARVASIESLMVEGLAAAERALAIDPNHAESVHVYAGLLKDIGLGEQALAFYRRACQLDPGHAGFAGSLLMALTYQGGDEEAWFAEHLRQARLIENVPVLPAVDPATRRERGRLRVGYISGDFRAHSIAYFTWPVIKAHDRVQVEVYGYFTGEQPDRETGLFEGLFDRWLDARGLDDAALAARIRADDIDLLVDLSSHTAHNRLGVFARRPAPVQVTWLGYAASTGLSRIDWRLSDATVDPPGSTERFHTERLYRLPGCGYCFSPSPDCPEAGPLPMANSGRLTLGSFSNSAKLTPRTVALWARVLKALPEATLRLFIYGGDEAPIAEHARRLFVAHGIAPARIEPFGKREFFTFMRLHQEVDLALDPLTFSGVTTTLYTLWMGVPVVTLPGRLPITRASASLLTALEMTDFVATDEDDYVAIVCRAAADPARLAALRDGLRSRLQASPLLDHAGFTRRLEAAWRRMWQFWLDGAGPPGEV